MTTETAGPSRDSHETAPTRFVAANGVRYAYRRFGAETGTPVVFLQHFRGGMDHWDPLGLTHVDALGFSIGGYVAQALTLRHRDLVRRLVLAGTKPRARLRPRLTVPVPRAVRRRCRALP